MDEELQVILLMALVCSSMTAFIFWAGYTDYSQYPDEPKQQTRRDSGAEIVPEEEIRQARKNDAVRRGKSYESVFQEFGRDSDLGNLVALWD